MWNPPPRDHDVLTGGKGDDLLCGQGGEDQLDGGPDDDVILAGHQLGEPNGRREWADLEVYRDGEGEVVPARLVLNDGAVVVDAVADGWIRESDPKAPPQKGLVSVWGTPPAGPTPEGRRRGLLDFDLSGVTVPIVSAELWLYVAEGQDTHNETAFDQHAVSLQVASTAEVTWATYPIATPFDTLGQFLFAAGGPVGTYSVSDPASRADVARLEAARTGTGHLAMGLHAPDDVRVHATSVDGGPGADECDVWGLGCEWEPGWTYTCP